ncbi:MAG: PspA/IM30 family protein [Thermoguttaceae bacterium]|jgi:phage shock protein A
MGIFSRISDIISANFNEMADNFEDPEKMLKQAIREMEESIADATQQTAKAMANEKTLARELQRNRQQAGVWQSRAEAAVAAGDDDLARKALVRRREHEDLAAALEDQSQSANQAAVTLKRQLDAMRAKLAEAKRSLATLTVRKRAADFRKQVECQVAGLTPEIDESAFAKFDRLKAKVEQAEAEAEALAELRSGVEAPPPSREELAETPSDVAAELAEMKRKLRK